MEERTIDDYPRLRPVEAYPSRLPGGAVVLRDPTGLAAGAIAVPRPTLAILALMDGTHRRLEIQAAFARQFGQLLLSDELQELIEQLDRAGFLEGEAFERHYETLAAEYVAQPYRPLRQKDGFGVPDAQLAGYLTAIVDAADTTGGPCEGGSLVGLIAPHLDFARGDSCYGAAYRLLRETPKPARVVILGTNHFGRSRAVVATRKDWETPFGIVPGDVEFLERLESRCGASLCAAEFDHSREHSVELQLVWLRHLLGAGFRVVSFLCPDPSGPTGTAPSDGRGADLRRFAEELGRLAQEDPEPTLLVAGADLSHVGTFFGDSRSLDESTLNRVRESDLAALRHVDANEPEAYRAHMAATGNPTRVCSVGCIYALMTALGAQARAARLAYHQAVTGEIDNAVTCAAYAFWVW
jgi:AmmeMemoRadiSam system protein B